MFFASDNAGPVHPNVIHALTAANSGYAAPYGNDELTSTVTQTVRDLFEAPQSAVYLVATGTAANALILASQSKPWQTVFCARHAHIQEDECNAPEFFSGGAKLTLVDGPDGKMDAAKLRTAIEADGPRSVHVSQSGPVSITQVTEKGTLYSLDELRALTDTAKSFGLPTHMDGARFANALVALNCSPAELTWKSGIDALSLGGTKNGLLGVEAVVLFNPDQAWEFELRRKRAAHLFSKHRYLAAQMQAYFAEDLWLDLAARANAACARLTRGLKQIEGIEFQFEPRANMIFATLPREAHQRLQAAGAVYDVSQDGAASDLLTARLVTDWSATDENTDRFLEVLRG